MMDFTVLQTEKTFSMRKVILCLLLCNVFTAATVIVTNNYTVDPDLDNKLSTEALIGEYKAASLSVCLAMCSDNCACVGFNSQTNKCRLHNLCFEAGNADVETNWRNFKAASSDGPSKGNTINLPVNCKEIYDGGQRVPGVYTIYPYGNMSVDVYCDMETTGGGWTVIQRRRNGSVNFNRNWSDYKIGFGNAQESYWIGNDVIHNLTKGNDSSLYLSITLLNGTTAYELYEKFSVSDEANQYRLFLGGTASGTLGDGMLNTGSNGKNLSGMAFSTHDKDNDLSKGDCADHNKGGWWFNSCQNVFLNGPWAAETWYRPWYPIIRNGANITETKMMIKQR